MLVRNRSGPVRVPQPNTEIRGIYKVIPRGFPLHPPVNMSCETGSRTPLFLHPQRADDRQIDSPDVPFWANMQSADIDWSDCLSEVQSLLNSPSKLTLTRSFEGTNAQMFINLLDHVSCSRPLCPLDSL